MKQRGRTLRARRLGTVAAAITVVVAVPIAAFAITTNGDDSPRIEAVAPSSTATTHTLPSTAPPSTTDTAPPATSPLTVPHTGAPPSTDAQDESPPPPPPPPTTVPPVDCHNNTTDPMCGPLRYDPPIVNDPPTLEIVSVQPANPVAGDTVTLTVHATDPDTGIRTGVACDLYANFGAGPVKDCVVGCTSGPQYGTWDPPPPQPSDVTKALTYTYDDAGTFTVEVILRAGWCTPYFDFASVSVDVTVSP